MYEYLALLCQQAHEYQNFSQKPEFLILTVLSGVAAHHGKNYCFPAQDKIVDLLGRYGRHMSRRTLNRHMNALVRGGWIKRVRRHQRCPTRGMTFRSSLYSLTRRSFRWLSGLKDAVRRAVLWGVQLPRKTRVPNSAQHIHSMDSCTGSGPPKPGGPPPEQQKEGCGGTAADQTAKKKTPAEYLSDLRRITNA